MKDIMKRLLRLESRMQTENSHQSKSKKGLLSGGVLALMFAMLVTTNGCEMFQEVTGEALRHRLAHGCLGMVGGYDDEGYHNESKVVVEWLEKT